MNETNEAEQVLFDKCIRFLNSIGIPTQFRAIAPDSFLPGYLIENGMIIIDRQLLQHPGDILHEAGHIAVVPAADRPHLTEQSIPQRKNREAEELMAIAWSYAACMYLLIDPAFVFHEEGYRGGSSYITETCGNNTYFGLSMLQGIGLTADNEQTQRVHIPYYPHMIKWLRA